MPKHTLTGNIKRHRGFPSDILGNRRDVLVYLPPGYRRFSRRRYPVLYLHDGQYVSEELKPYIDRKYSTKRETQFTGLGGSSLGGLVTLAIGILFPGTFTRLMVMSPSIWWDDFAIYRLVDSIEEKPPLKIWLDTGTREPGWEQARVLCNRLAKKGWRLRDDLQYMEVEGAEHTEAARSEERR